MSTYVKLLQFFTKAHNDFSVKLMHHPSSTLFNKEQFDERATIESSQISWQPLRLIDWSILHFEQNIWTPSSVSLQWLNDTSVKLEHTSFNPSTVLSLTAESSLTSRDFRFDETWAKNCFKPFDVISSKPQRAKCSSCKSVLSRNKAKISSLRSQLLLLLSLSSLLSSSSTAKSSQSVDIIVTCFRLLQFFTNKDIPVAESIPQFPVKEMLVSFEQCSDILPAKSSSNDWQLWTDRTSRSGFICSKRTWRSLDDTALQCLSTSLVTDCSCCSFSWEEIKKTHYDKLYIYDINNMLRKFTNLISFTFYSVWLNTSVISI